MKNFTIEFYEKSDGSCPVRDFLLSLNTKVETRFASLIDLLEEKGNQLREPYSKYLEDGIFELRYQNDEQPVRILFFFYYEKRIILTNGFIKKTRKTPRTEIKKAKDCRKEFLKGVNNDNV